MTALWWCVALLFVLTGLLGIALGATLAYARKLEAYIASSNLAHVRAITQLQDRLDRIDPRF